MRIDLLELAKHIRKAYLKTALETLNEKHKLYLTLNLWDNFIHEMTPANNGQIALFASPERKRLAYPRLGNRRGTASYRRKRKIQFLFFEHRGAKHAANHKPSSKNRQFFLHLTVPIEK